MSGGVSLGAYQAGYLDHSLAARRANPSLGKAILATGASAKRERAAHPEIFMRGHHARPAPEPLPPGLGADGLRQLFQPDEASPVAAFSQKAFQDVGAMVEEELARALPEDCDVVLT